MSKRTNSQHLNNLITQALILLHKPSPEFVKKMMQKIYPHLAKLRTRNAFQKLWPEIQLDCFWFKEYIQKIRPKIEKAAIKCVGLKVEDLSEIETVLDTEPVVVAKVMDLLGMTVSQLCCIIRTEEKLRGEMYVDRIKSKATLYGPASNTCILPDNFLIPPLPNVAPFLSQLRKELKKTRP